jgi:hypothetical protein
LCLRTDHSPRTPRLGLLFDQRAGVVNVALVPGETVIAVSSGARPGHGVQLVGP